MQTVHREPGCSDLLTWSAGSAGSAVVQPAAAAAASTHLTGAQSLHPIVELLLPTNQQ